MNVVKAQENSQQTPGKGRSVYARTRREPFVEKDHAVQKGEKQQRGEGHMSMCSCRAGRKRVAALLCGKAAVSTTQRTGWREDGKAESKEEKLQPGGAQQDVSKGNEDSVLCIKAKV